MDYKKKYETALERAKVIYQGSYKPDTAATIAEILQNVFPELIESEDERIRKAILEHIQLCTESIPDRDKFIAWLEKQGEQKPVDTYCKENCKGYRETGKCYADGSCDAKIKAEQKPVWSEEDDKLFSLTLDMVEWYSGKNEKNSRTVSDWLKSLKNRIIPQQKEWSEEDEQIALSIGQVMNCAALLNIVPEKISKIRTWLQSLKQRATWKPSEEQIEAFEHFVRGIGESGYASPYENNTKLLYSLLEQLKKLK